MCEQPDLVGTTWRTARKQHTCSECDAPIVKGERYEEYASLYEGSWDHHKFCVSCEAWWTEFWRWQRRAGEDFCVEVGQLAGILGEVQETIEYRERDRVRREEYARRNATVVTGAP